MASHQQTGALRVKYGNTPVNRPRVVELELRNTGRCDITADMFHGDEPIRFELAAGVVSAILAVDSTPTETSAPPVTTSGSQILVSPCHLVRAQAVTISLLVDGPKQDVHCQSAPLINVKLQTLAELDRRKLLLTNAWFALPAILTMITAATALVSSFGG